jgi:hypothetical protein
MELKRTLETALVRLFSANSVVVRFVPKADIRAAHKSGPTSHRLVRSRILDRGSAMNIAPGISRRAPSLTLQARRGCAVDGWSGFALSASLDYAAKRGQILI